VELIEFTCAACGRRSAVRPQLFATMRRCTYCGEPVEMSAELQSKIAAKAAADGSWMLSVECPICAHVQPEANSVAGSETKCKICGCPYQVPKGDGPGLDPPPLGIGAISGQCPFCGRGIFVGVPVRPIQCSGCGKEIKPDSVPITKLLGLEWPGQPMARVTEAAIQARWTAGLVSPSEAKDTSDSWSLLSRWRPGVEISPLSQDLTASIVQHQVLKLSGAVQSRASATETVLRIYKGNVSAFGNLKDTALEVAGMLLLNSIIGIASAITRVHIDVQRIPLASSAESEPSVILTFASAAEGTLLRGHYQAPSGNVEPLARKTVEELAGVIRREFRVHAQSFLAFRALYGMWATPAMMVAAAPAAVAARIDRFCPGLSLDALELAEEILETVRRAQRPSR
jgi:hypothetical protein